MSYAGSDQDEAELADGEAMPEGVDGINACKDINEIEDLYPKANDEIALEAVYVDDCAASVTATFKSEDFTILSTSCKWTLERIYTISDGCPANDFDVTMTYTGSDQTEPTIASALCGVTQNKTTDNDSDYDHCIYTADTDFDVVGEDNCDDAVTMNWTVVDANETRTGTGSLAGVVFIPGTSTVAWTATDDCGLTSDACSFNVVVTIPTTIEVSTSAQSTRWLDYITLYAVVDGDCGGYPFSGMVNFEIGGVPVGSAPANLIPFEDEGYEAGNNKYRATLIYKIEDDALLAMIDDGQTAFGVTAIFVPDGSIYTGSDNSDNPTALKIYQRLAEPKFGATGGFYTGDIVGWITDGNSNSVSVLMSATLVDNSTPTGDLRGAKVTFCYINGDGTFSPIPNAKDIPVGLVNQLDGKVGFASADVQLSIAKTAQSESFDIAVVISGGYYNVPIPFGKATITVARTLSKGSILGNCSVLNDNSAGQIKGAKGTISYINGDGEPVTGIPTTNIAFNVEYNRKATNPQGYLNLTVISWYDKYGVLDNKLHTYFVKSNAITSFVVGPLTKPVLTANQSIFEAKANVKELVEISSGVYQWVSVEGNSPIRTTITDGGTTGTDKIAVTFFRASGGIWFSNNWDGIKTNEQAIESGGFITGGSGSSITKGAAIIDPTLTEEKFMVFPNPFTEKLFFKFTSPTDTHARLEIFNITGAKLATLFDAPVEAGRQYKAEYVPNLVSSQMVIYRLTMNGQTRVGKMVYQERQ